MSYNTKNQMSFNPVEALNRRKWQLAACLTLVCAMAVATVTVFAPKYEATAQVKVTTEGQPVASSLGALLGGNSSYNSQVELLKSDRVYEMALARLNSDPSMLSPITMRQLRESSRLRTDQQASVVKIVGISADAQRAAAIANNLSSSFTETSSVMKNAQANVLLDQMTDQILLLESKVKEKETELDSFRRDNMIIGSGATIDNSEKIVNDLQVKMRGYISKEAELNAQLAVMQKITMGDLNDPMAIPIETVRKDTTVNAMIREIASMEDTEKEFARIYLPGHRELQKVRQKIALAKDNLVRHTQMLLISLQKQNVETLATIALEKETISKEISVNKAQALNNGEIMTRMSRLNNELADARKMRDQIHNEIQQYKFRQKLTGDPVTIVCAANVPDTTAGLSPRKRAGSVLLLGSIFSIIFVLGLEKMRITELTCQQNYGMPMSMPYPQPMYMPANYQVANGYAPTGNNAGQSHENEKHVEVLGRISGVAVEELDGKINDSMLYNLVHTYPHCQQAEQYREISTNLLSRFGKTRQSLVITGNEAKSGKTVLVCNLAHLLAQAGRSVLIVNANPTSDKLTKAFAIGRTIYADLVLNGNYNLDEFICKSENSSIATLTLDLDNRPDTSELEQSISALNWKLQSRYDWVIYDTSSIGYYDTDNILQVIGKAIFVSRSSSTENKLIATEQIEQRGAVSLGCVEMPGSSHSVSYQNA
ncbi:MAG: hypothetical protein JW745_03145 [Sedimentisphaerales bacterium]|nr:hypothetical protein [Sedimentisphaerales bacterium]MBN2842304.1 hypothetical protein [Sedimentisphaerales bacterium]